MFTMVEGTVAGQIFNLISLNNLSYVVYGIDYLIPPLLSLRQLYERRLTEIFPGFGLAERLIFSMDLILYLCRVCTP